MEINLRKEREADFSKTENVVREAFWNCYVPGCNEHYLLHVMRACPDFVPELDFVATDGEKIVGNIVYVKTHILTDRGNEIAVLTLGPIAVLPEYRRKGVGKKLIERTSFLAAQMGFRAIVLCGDPDFYSRVGFVEAESAGIRAEDNTYFKALQVRGLYENALEGLGGRYVENQIYNAAPKAVLAFDKKFPRKEPLSGTPSQKRFEEILAFPRKRHV